MLSVCIIRHAVAAGYLLRHSWAKWGKKKTKKQLFHWRLDTKTEQDTESQFVMS